VVLDTVCADAGAGRLVLRDKLRGIPTLAVMLIALAWAAREILLLARTLRPAEAKAEAGSKLSQPDAGPAA